MAETETVDRPESMSAALEQAEASAASDPSASSDTASSASAASQPAASSTSAEVTGTTPGPIPYERFKEVNEKGKGLEAKLAQLAWAEGYNPQQIQELRTWYARAQSGDPTFIREYLANAPADKAAAIRSEAARILGQRAQAAQDDAEPAPDLNTEVGPMRSPQNLAAWQQWRERQLMGKFGAQIAPLQQQLQTYQQREQAQERLQGIVAFTQGQAMEAKAWPHFEAYKTEIAAAYENAPQPDPNWSDRERNFFEAQQLRTAYIKVLGEKLPGLVQQTQQQATSEVLSTLQQRAHARTEGGGPAASTPTKPKSFLEALEQAARR